ncbi:amine oxidase-5 [Coleophoma cylindrospora]|uniref:Amine oxidase n=1 Tax=Coleophoma cylindrospora TaxID=1849047 RepID=A0A3D8R5J5_9HELO|nr:amine oxidase-5 [Coleophoma cylindrospora]
MAATLSRSIAVLACVAILLLHSSQAKPHGFKGSQKCRRGSQKLPNSPAYDELCTATVRTYFTTTTIRPEPYATATVSSSTGGQCKSTKVAVLGAGVAGITAAQVLSNHSVTDFLILEYNTAIGGRCRADKFGKDRDGDPYTVELGANWIQGTVTEGGPENPIWTLVKKYGVKNEFTNLSSLLTYDKTGQVDYTDKFDAFDAAYSFAEEDAGTGILMNFQDRDLRSAFNLGGWTPKGDPHAMAIEWYEMDYEYAQIPDVSSQRFTTANFNSTFYGFSELNQFSTDQRGYNTFLHGQASEFLEDNDPRLLLNTIVTNISYSDSGVTIYNSDGSCVEADYAITTFSVGVLQSNAVTFEPPLPDWKNIAINTMQIGVYTKIFLQFPPDQAFWPKDTENFIYASKKRGYYTAWQNLDHPKYIPGSGIIFCTVTTEQSYAVDNQDDEITKAEVLAVLREMFPNSTIPEPIAFMYPRWSTTPWAYGSYSNWPPGLSLEGHQNLRANIQRLFFAGEATSAEFYGYMQGAYFEGKNIGELVAACTGGIGLPACMDMARYESLGGDTPVAAYVPSNGWMQTSFQTIGDVDVVGGGG